MSTKPRKKGTPPCPVRTFILRRVKEVGSNLSEFSCALRRNESYAQQFVWRGSPKTLDRATRERMAPLLGVEPDMLVIPENGAAPARQLPTEPLSAERAEELGAAIRAAAREAEAETARRKAREPAPAEYATAPGAQVDGSSPLPMLCRLPPELIPHIPVGGMALFGDLPQFTDADFIEPPPGGWQNHAGGLALGGASFALWITQPRGRLRADVVLVRAVPPRVGDLVVVLQNSRVAAVGELCGLTGTEARVSQGDIHLPDGATAAFPRGSVQLLKVAAAEFA